jgi:hypothetical protein
MSAGGWGWHPNKYIWNNNGTWWLKCTPFDPVVKRRPIVRSLKTRDIDEARRRRDELLEVNNWKFTR